MSELLLDSDVLIDIQRGIPQATQWFATLSELPHTSCFSALELLGGSRNKREHRAVEKLLQPLLILYPTVDTLQRAIFDLSPLCFSHGVGFIDLLISAVAIEYDLTLVTFNRKHFRAIPNLRTFQPYPRG